MVDDAELVARWRDGDQASGRELFDRYFKRLYRFFATKTDRGVEDLIQETLLACVEGLGTLRGPEGFRAFLFGTARRRLYRRWRNENRGANAIDFGLTSVVDIQPTPSTAIAEQHEHRAVIEALRRIPVDLQIAVEMFYWEELRAADVAEILEVPEGTIRSRLRRARQLLRAQLDGDVQADDAELAHRVARSMREIPVAKPPK